MLVGPFLVSSHTFTDYCLKEDINNFDLRRSFYSKQDLKNCILHFPHIVVEISSYFSHSSLILSSNFWSVGKWISRCADDTRRLWKTKECCRRARECIKESLITYSDSWKYWCAAQRNPEYGKLDKWMSADI